MGFNSKTLGREITADHLQDITDHSVITNLWFEVGDALSGINAELLRTPRHINQGLNPQHESLARKRAFLAPFHQRVAHRKSQLRDASGVQAPIRGESPHSDAIANVPSIESIYYITARKELDPATHQRLLLIAEQRRHTLIARVTGLAMGR
jgi:hypothetical protein